MTSKTIEDRFKRHIICANKNIKNCRKLVAAMRKHGVENFIIEKIESCETLDLANESEIKHIKNYDSIKSGYNLQQGGYNGFHSKETLALMSEQRKGEKNVMFGKTHTPEAIAKIIAANKANPPQYWKGKNHSKETIDKISISRKGLTTGENNPGAKLTLEQANQIKDLFKNSNYTRQEIADMFNVSLSCIKRIKAGTHWK